MTITIKEISLGLVWILFGVISSWLFIQMIKTGVNKLEPGQKPLSITFILLGSLLRWVLMGTLLYLAIRMHIIYAVLFLLAFTLTRFLLIIRLHRQTNEISASVGED